MSVSLYSFLMAVLWFSVLILLGVFLQRKGFVLCHQVIPLLFLPVLTMFRLAVPIELPITKEVCSTGFYPAVQASLRATWITVRNTAVSGTHVLLEIWAIVAVILCIRLCLHIHRDSNVIKNISALPCQSADQCLKQLCFRRGITRKVKLSVSPNVMTPVLVGLIRPTILLPQRCADLSVQELECILAHELTHLVCGDLWAKCLARVLCCLMWWNPCVYLLKKDLDIVLEYKCDLAVTKAMEDKEKIQYLQTVLNVSTQMEKCPLSKESQIMQASFCGIPEKTILKRRFHLILNQREYHKRFSTTAFIAGFLLLFAFSYSIILQPASEPPAGDLVNEVVITPETSYILVMSDGTYYLIYNGEKWDKLSPEILQDNPYCFLTIQKNIEEN